MEESEVMKDFGTSKKGPTCVLTKGFMVLFLY